MYMGVLAPRLHTLLGQISHYVSIYFVTVFSLDRSCVQKCPAVMQPPGARSQSAGLKRVLVSDQLKMLSLNMDLQVKCSLAI